MAGKKEYFFGRLRKVSHKGMKSTKGFIAPSSGLFRSNLAFETDLYLNIDDKVKYYMDHGEPRIVEKVRKR